MSISNRITLLNKYKDTVLYLAKCSCMSDNHDLMIYIEKDNRDNEIKLEFYIDVILNEYYWFYNKTIFSKIKNFFSITWKRFTIALRVLFKGRIEMNQEFLISNKDQINDFIKALEEGKNFLKED